MPKQGHTAKLPPEFEGDPIDRGQHESAESYGLFQRYLQLGPKRTTKAVAELAEVQQSHATVRGLCSRFFWVARSRAYDSTLAAAAQQADANVTARRAEELAYRRTTIEDEAWELANEVIKIARKMLSVPLTETVVEDNGKTTIIKPAKWHMGNLPQLLNTASQLWGLGTGVAPGGMDEGVMKELMSGIMEILEEVVEEKDRLQVAQRFEILANAIDQKQPGKLHNFPADRTG